MNQPFQIRNIFTSPPATQPHPPAPSPSRPRLYHISHTPYSILHTPFKFLKWLIIGGSPKIRLATDELETKRRRLALSIGAILLIVLVLSAIFGYYRRQELVRKNRLSSWRSRADWIISQADQLSQVSPSRAGELVREERLSLGAEVEKSKDKKLTASLQTLISALAESERRVSRVIEVTPELYLSLGLVRPNTSGRLVSASQDQLGILSSDGVVLLMSMTGRSGEVVAGGDLIKQGIDMAVSADKIFVLNPDNIVEIDNQKKTSAVAVTDEDDAWVDPVRLSAFAGSLFILDKSNSEIYKYLPAEKRPVSRERIVPEGERQAKAGSSIESDGYGSARRWLAPGITPDFSNVIDMAIDGDIWLLHQDGRLDRYRRGAPAGFKQSGLPADRRAMSRVRIEPEGEWQAQAGLPAEASAEAGLVSPQALSVPVDGSRVWILDASTRVVAFDKESGEYFGQWQFTGVDAADLAVSETRGKIFLLAGENIYVINF